MIITKSGDRVWHCNTESIIYIRNLITLLDCRGIKEYVTLSEDCEASLEEGENIKACERFTLDVFMQSKRQCPQHSQTPSLKPYLYTGCVFLHVSRFPQCECQVKRFGRLLTARSCEPMRVIEIPEKTSRPTVSSGMIPTCKGPVTRPGIEPNSPWWEASRLTAQPPWPLPHGVKKASTSQTRVATSSSAALVRLLKDATTTATGTGSPVVSGHHTTTFLPLIRGHEASLHGSASVLKRHKCRLRHKKVSRHSHCRRRRAEDMHWKNKVITHDDAIDVVVRLYYLIARTVRREHCTSVQILALSGDGSVARIVPAPLDPKRGEKFQLGGDLKITLPYLKFNLNEAWDGTATECIGRGDHSSERKFTGLSKYQLSFPQAQIRANICQGSFPLSP
ncbi:hypothetical protein PR048_001047 [Dryococelus australis]|uniref:Uncharacterized protein n=1 Tax=Dryococelus australis TaxID=614101 RepID=A0ABQ9IGA2_9NEOP|nr:hypothetical protein PR048_001047 [Dryococelus australis]